MRGIGTQLMPDLVQHVLDAAPIRYQLASCSESESVTLWGPAGPRQLLGGHASNVLDIEFFPQGDRVLTLAEDGTAIIWNTTSGAALHMLRGPVALERARVFPGGDRIVTCSSSDSTCTIWRASSGESMHVLATSETPDFMVKMVEVFPSGDRVLTWGRERTASVWDIAVGGEVCSLSSTSEINIAAVFADGSRIVTSGVQSQVATIWDVPRCAVLRNLAHAHTLIGLAALHSGDKVATMTHEGATSIWHVASGDLLRHFGTADRDLSERHFRIQAFPQDDRVVTFGIGSVTIWDVAMGEPLHTIAFDGLDDIAISQGGDVLVTCGNGKVIVWETNTGRQLHVLQEAPKPRFQESSEDEAIEETIEEDIEDDWPDDITLGSDSVHAITDCRLAIGLGTALDPSGFGPGLSWRQLP